MSGMVTGELLTVRDVADQLGVSAQTVRRWVREGDLEALKLGSRRGASVRIPPRAVDQFLQRPAGVVAP
jgi:excisionase family DNA binding protein